MQLRSKQLILSYALLVLSCIEPYDPPVEQRVLDILVVEGFMNATDRTASVRLSHTLTISDSNKPIPELNANVSVRSSHGASYLLSELDSGQYLARDLIIDKNSLYTLHIKTKSGIEYVSDTIRVKETPPIDSLNFGISNDERSLTVRVNTHDPKGKARYYAWDYIETYQYHAVFFSGFTYINQKPNYRKPEESIYTCWHTLPSTSIVIGSSSGLGEDIIHQYPIVFLPKESSKISARYSILVKQRAISAEEYNYLSVLRKTTENLGSLFDTMPARVTGNIHQENDASATVLGFFSSAEVSEKRFFIERDQLPEEFKILQPKQGCVLTDTCPAPPPPFTGSCIPIGDLSHNAILIYKIEDMGGLFYQYTTPECGDCRKQGGTTKRPDFW
jgi:Domain of unknown function (DUF4249)